MRERATAPGHFSQINQEDVDACNLEGKDKGSETVYGLRFTVSGGCPVAAHRNRAKKRWSALPTTVIDRPDTARWLTHHAPNIGLADNQIASANRQRVFSQGNVRIGNVLFGS